MQGINAQDGKQALASLGSAKFKELQRGLEASAKKFELDDVEPTPERLEAQRAAAVERNDEAAEMFENYFATMLVKEMRASLSTGFFEGAGSDVYGAWFDEHLGAALRQGDGMGVGKMIKGTLAPDQARSTGQFGPSNTELRELLAADKRQVAG